MEDLGKHRGQALLDGQQNPRGVCSRAHVMGGAVQFFQSAELLRPERGNSDRSNGHLRPPPAYTAQGFRPFLTKTKHSPKYVVQLHQRILVPVSENSNIYI